MELIKELQRMFESEIGFQITVSREEEIFIEFGVFDENGAVIKSDANNRFTSIANGIYWMIDMCLEIYPKSKYSFIRTGLINKIREGHVDTNKFTAEFLNKMLCEYERKNPGIYLEFEREYFENKK